MIIKILIQVNQIHLFPVYDENGNPTGDEEVQFGIRCPDYPDLPTYGMRLPYPCTKADVDTAIEAKCVEIKKRMQKDNQLRQQVETMYNKVTIKGTEFFETEVEV